jgi:hypothetical protein
MEAWSKRPQLGRSRRLSQEQGQVRLREPRTLKATDIRGAGGLTLVPEVDIIG